MILKQQQKNAISLRQIDFKVELYPAEAGHGYLAGPPFQPGIFWSVGSVPPDEQLDWQTNRLLAKKPQQTTHNWENLKQGFRVRILISRFQPLLQWDTHDKHFTFYFLNTLRKSLTSNHPCSFMLINSVVKARSLKRHISKFSILGYKWNGIWNDFL